jgi:cellulose synthase/poly-beta-1,6-N-acetylglucosamine synthase-like glycosyltransferase
MPRVSVLMSVLNGQEFLRPAVDSVLAQTFTDFEFIVIDNASRDDTPAILASYSDTRIIRLRNDRMLSLTQSLNKGLGVARGEYVARLDADDVAAPARLARQVELLDRDPQILLAGSGARVIDEHGCVTRRIDPPVTSADLYDALAWSNPIIHSSAMFRRDAAAAAGGYPETYVYAQDLALWLKLAERGRLGIVPELLVDLREHGRQATQAPELAVTRNREMIAIFGAAQRLPGLSADARRRGRSHLATLHCLLAGALLSAGRVPSAVAELLHGLYLAPVFCARRALAGRWRVAFPGGRGT